MIMHDVAIDIQNVSKSYKVYTSKFQQVLDLLNIRTVTGGQQHYAIKDFSVKINKGEKVAFVGRNGAGKTTLLKLITGNFKPTNGDLHVDGAVQALMDMGLGFHPEFSGLENIHASLMYNGLPEEEYKRAVEDIIDFVELGDYINYPLKTYSLGMQSRLYFAVATAIKPEILIIDEVLGAGDAYFSAKSADRMQKLAGSGCTLILVSHSMTQVLQFCDRAIWIENGELVMDADSLSVIKAYEEYSKKLELEYASTQLNTQDKPVLQSKWLRDKLLKETLAIVENSEESEEAEDASNVHISRWPRQEKGLIIDDVKMFDNHNTLTRVFEPHMSMSFNIDVKAEYDGEFDCIYVILIFTNDGRWVTRHCSERVKLTVKKDQIYTMQLHYQDLLLGNGRYIYSAAIYKELDLKDQSTARYYDLLTRSFEFEVIAPLSSDDSILYHPCEWRQLPISASSKLYDIEEAENIKDEATT